MVLSQHAAMLFLIILFHLVNWSYKSLIRFFGDDISIVLINKQRESLKKYAFCGNRVALKPFAIPSGKIL